VFAPHSSCETVEKVKLRHVKQLHTRITVSPVSRQSQGEPHASTSWQWENHLGRARDFGISPIVDRIQIPGPLFALDPLSPKQWGQTEILFIEFNGAHYRLEICLSQGLSDLLFVNRPCTLQGVGKKLEAGVIETQG